MIDSHCHLDFDAFNGQQDKLLSDAEKAGVHTVINVGADMESSQRSIALAETRSMVWATVGVHPHDAKTVDDSVIARLKEWASHDRVVAIGEIGLDYYRDLSPRPVQKAAFIKQLELAVQVKLPVVIHTRDAFDDTLEIVKNYASDLPGGVFHCFPGNADQANQVFELGMIVSVGGVITFGKMSGMAEMASQVPLDRLLIETDAPYLTPAPHRGKRNEPAYVRLVCQRLAELQNTSFAEVEKVTDRTCRKLFGIVETFGG